MNATFSGLPLQLVWRSTGLAPGVSGLISGWGGVVLLFRGLSRFCFPSVESSELDPSSVDKGRRLVPKQQTEESQWTIVTPTWDNFCD